VVPLTDKDAAEKVGSRTKFVVVSAPSCLAPVVVETRHQSQATMGWWIVGAPIKVGAVHDGDQPPP